MMLITYKWNVKHAQWKDTNKVFFRIFKGNWELYCEMEYKTPRKMLGLEEISEIVWRKFSCIWDILLLLLL